MTKSRKLFSLLYNDEVHINPAKKILSPQEYSEVLDSEGLINKMHEELLQKQQEESEEAAKQKEAAKEAGHQEGLEKWAGQLAQFEQSLQALKAEMEKNIVPVAIKAAEKVVGREMAENPAVFIDIVKQSLKAVAQDRRFTLYVNPKELAVFDKAKPEFKQILEQVDSFSIVPREDVPAGQCTIETEAGIINVNVEELWKALEAAFQHLVKS